MMVEMSDYLYVVIQENLTYTVDVTKTEHPDVKISLLKKTSDQSQLLV